MNDSMAEGETLGTNPCSECFGYLAVLYLCGESEIYYIYMNGRLMLVFCVELPKVSTPEGGGIRNVQPAPPV